MTENTGTMKWKKKKVKRISQANAKRDDQIGLCRFIQLTWCEYKKINGKIRCAGIKKELGLQVENNFFYGKDRQCKRVNSRGVKIKVLAEIPENLPAAIMNMYYKYIN